MYSEVDENMKTDQRANDYEKQVNAVVINGKRWTGAHGFTSGVSQVNKISMRWVNE